MEPNNFEQIAPFVSIMFAVVFVIVGLIVAAIKVWIFCRVFSKAGYSWALGLLMMVPIANIIMPFVLAFGDWPICRELRQLRERQSGAA